MRCLTVLVGVFLTTQIPACVYAPNPEGDAPSEEDAENSPRPEPDPEGWGDDDGDPWESAGGDEAGDDDGDNDTGFIPTSDAPTGRCDPTLFNDCPEGEKCSLYAADGSPWSGARCTPVAADPDGPGEPCVFEGHPNDGVDSCQPGHVCWDAMQMGSEYIGTCIPYCEGGFVNPHCADEGRLCNIWKSIEVGLCLPRCDPSEIECPTGCTCVHDPGGQGFSCISDASGDEGQYADPCQYANSCDPGLFCAGADAVPSCNGSQGCCSEFCKISQPNDCSGKDGGQECVAWYEEGQAPEGLEDIGGCAIPE